MKKMRKTKDQDVDPVPVVMRMRMKKMKDPGVVIVVVVPVVEMMKMRDQDLVVSRRMKDQEDRHHQLNVEDDRSKTKWKIIGENVNARNPCYVAVPIGLHHVDNNDVPSEWAVEE